LTGGTPWRENRSLNARSTDQKASQTSTLAMPSSVEPMLPTPSDRVEVAAQMDDLVRIWEINSRDDFWST